MDRVMDQSQSLSSLHPVSQAECRTVPDMLGRVGDKWTILIIGNLSAGPLRYKQLQRQIDGISQRMLTLTLKGLEEDGLVSRTVFPTVPPRVDYELTPLGRGLIQVLNGLHNWVVKHKPDILAARARYAERSDI
jgi:DNA-binding HxlR family transcriptional regulator